MAKSSESKINANRRYAEKNYDRINVYVAKGLKSIIRNFANLQNKSVNQYINEAIEAKMSGQD